MANKILSVCVCMRAWRP